MNLMKNKGFTLVEILAVLIILSIILTLAIPGVLRMRDRMNEKGYKSKVELIEKTAKNYAEENSNRIKRELGNKCTSNSDRNCKCGNNGCFYIYKITLQKLIDLGEYEAEVSDENSCKVVNPLSSTKCMEKGCITISINSNHRTSTASYNIDESC